MREGGIKDAEEGKGLEEQMEATCPQTAGLPTGGEHRRNLDLVETCV